MSVVPALPGAPDQSPTPRCLQRLQAPLGVIDTGPVLRRWQRTAGWAAEWMARSGHLVARYTSAIGDGATEPLLMVRPALPSGVDRAAISLPGDGAVRPPEAPGGAPAMAPDQPSSGPATPASALLQRWQRRISGIQTLQRRPATALLGASATAGVVDPVQHQRLLARAGVASGAATTANATALPVVTAFAAERAGAGGRVAETAPGRVSGLDVLAATEPKSPGQPALPAPSARQQRPDDAGHSLPVQRAPTPSQPTADVFGGPGPLAAATDHGSGPTVIEALTAVHRPAAMSSPAADALVPARPPSEPKPGATALAAAALSRATVQRSLASPADPLLSTRPPALALARPVEPGVPTGPTADPTHFGLAQLPKDVLARAAVVVDAAAPEPPGAIQPLAHRVPATSLPSSPAMAQPGTINTAAIPTIMPRALGSVAHRAVPLVDRLAGQHGLAGLPTEAPLPAPPMTLQRDAGTVVAGGASAGAPALAGPSAEPATGSDAWPVAGATAIASALAVTTLAAAPRLARSAEVPVGTTPPKAALVWQRPAPAVGPGPGGAAATHQLMRSSSSDDRAVEAGRPSAVDAGPAETLYSKGVLPAPGPDLADVAEQVTRLIARRLVIERERRGGPR